MTKSIYYDIIPESPLGAIWVAVSKNALLSIQFDQQKEGFLGELRTQFETEPQQNSARLAPFTASINRFLAKQSTTFDLSIDLRNVTPFQHKILNQTRLIPYGHTTTYGELADKIGQPTASRAVGQALRSNPIPIVIPCHRVLNANGTLGGYGGNLGSARKITLLKLEDIILT